MNAEIKRYIDRQIAHLARKMRNIVARGVVAMVDDGKKMQGLQISLLDGELIDNAERPQQYGFSAHPQKGAECFVVFAGANREHPLVLSVDDRRYRFKGGEEGEVIIYSDEGDAIHLKRGNIVEIKTKHLVIKAEDDALIESKAITLRGEESITLETPSLTAGGPGGAAGQAQITGDLATSGDMTAAGISLKNHLTTNVQPGGGVSGPPQGGGS